MTTKPLPDFDEYQDFPAFRVADDDETRALAIAHIDNAGTEGFLAAHSEFHQCPENAGQLASFLAIRGGLPFTKRNLEIAYYDLRDDGLLTSAPPPAAPEVDNSRGIILQVGDALAEYVTPADEQAALAKLKDDPSLSDHARKGRDEKLRLLAGQQRRDLTPLNIYRPR